MFFLGGGPGGANGPHLAGAVAWAWGSVVKTPVKHKSADPPSGRACEICRITSCHVTSAAVAVASKYSSISGHRFSATVVHMSCSPREVQGCSGGPRGDQGGPGLHFQTQISTLGGVAVLGCLILRADPVHGKDGTPPNTRFRVGGSQADMARPMKRARPRAMRSKMCRRPRPRPAQGLAAAAATNPAVEWFSFFLGWN